MDILNIGQPVQSDFESLYFSNAEFDFTPGLKNLLIRKNSIDENDWQTDNELNLSIGIGPSQITFP